MIYTLNNFFENPNLINEVPSKISMICCGCQSYFEINKCRVRQNIKRNNTKIFCSNKCSLKEKGIRTTTGLCSNCGTKVLRTNSEMKKSKTGRMFCSKSCAAAYNNKFYPKRNVEGKCKICSKPISSNKVYCEEHKISISNITLEDSIKQSAHTFPANRYRKIRNHALKLAKKNRTRK